MNILYKIFPIIPSNIDDLNYIINKLVFYINNLLILLKYKSKLPSQTKSGLLNKMLQDCQQIYSKIRKTEKHIWPFL